VFTTSSGVTQLLVLRARRKLNSLGDGILREPLQS